MLDIKAHITAPLQNQDYSKLLNTFNILKNGIVSELRKISLTQGSIREGFSNTGYLIIL